MASGLWITDWTRDELMAALSQVPAPSVYPALKLHDRVRDCNVQALTADDCLMIATAAAHCLSLPELPRGTTRIGMQTLQATALGGLQRIREKRGAVMN